MSVWTCAQARRALAAYHDRELDVTSQVAVQAHLRTCPSCLAERRRLAELSSMLRVQAQTRRTGDLGRIERSVLARIQVERQLSWRHQATRVFEDLHFMWAAVGATVATIAIVCVAAGMMRVALREQPLSMAALIGTMSSPGSNQNPVMVDGRMLLPRTSPPWLVDPPGLGRDDAVFALSAVVSREGRVMNLELLEGARRLPVADQAILELLDAAAQARFEPARAGGAPVAVSLVWLVAHTTVRGKKTRADWPVFEAPRPLPRTGMPVSERPSQLDTITA